MRTAVFLVAATFLAAPVYAQQTSQPEFRSFGYARLGYGGAFADNIRAAPAIGFGYRGELPSVAFDVSFFNYMIGTHQYYQDGSVFAGSVLKLQVLKFLDDASDRSMYVGGGLSWGTVSASGDATPFTSSWHGSGLQGEFSTGYEFRGNTPLRVFIQADVGVPFFRATRESFAVFNPPGSFRSTVVDRRFIPSAVVSFGMGWDTRKRRSMRPSVSVPPPVRLPYAEEARP
jgi:hypothetical protein